MSNTLPERRAASTLPPRQKQVTQKSPEQVISEAPLKTTSTEQTDPVNQTKPWLNGNLSESELWKFTKKKSFNFPVILQEQLNIVVNEKKKEVRGFNQGEVNETTVVIDYIIKGLKADLKKMGYDPD